MAHPSPQETHFYASSGGNAGLACVVAAKSLGHKATVVVPTTTKPMMIAKIMAAGADNVIQHGNSVGEADAYLKKAVLPRHENGVYCPPYDHPVSSPAKQICTAETNPISTSGKATQASSTS